MASIFINYISGIAIDTFQSNKKRKTVLIIGIILNLSLLIFFKYGNFISSNVNRIAEILHVPVHIVSNIILPLGISFFIFQGMSYIIDVYRKEALVQKNFLNLALYISFFPQLIAGPIVRYHDIDMQIRQRAHTMDLFISGAKRFIKGLVKKVIIANNVALVADQIFMLEYNQLSLSTAWLGIICYFIQIYYDFSGYSDMAIGLGRMFGFRFLENFNHPYISKSMKEFWTRWHISLSGWFKDYVYIPLGGNRKGKTKHLINIFFVFSIMGFWHGAAWTFAIFGIFIAVILIIESLGLEKILKKSPVFLQHLYLLFVFNLSLAIFRAENMNQTFNFWKNMIGIGNLSNAAYPVIYFLNAEIITMLIIGFLFSMPVSNWSINRYKNSSFYSNTFIIVEYVKTFVYLLGLILCCLYLVNSTYNPFIYFRF